MCLKIRNEYHFSVVIFLEYLTNQIVIQKDDIKYCIQISKQVKTLYNQSETKEKRKEYIQDEITQNKG